MPYVLCQDKVVHINRCLFRYWHIMTMLTIRCTYWWDGWLYHALWQDIVIHKIPWWFTRYFKRWEWMIIPYHNSGESILTCSMLVFFVHQDTRRPMKPSADTWMSSSLCIPPSWSLTWRSWWAKRKSSATPSSITSSSTTRPTSPTPPLISMSIGELLRRLLEFTITYELSGLYSCSFFLNSIMIWIN